MVKLEVVKTRTLSLMVGGRAVEGMIDTGATVSVVDMSLFPDREWSSGPPCSLRVADGRVQYSNKYLNVPIVLGEDEWGVDLEHPLLGMETSGVVQIVLGLDFLTGYEGIFKGVLFHPPECVDLKAYLLLPCPVM